MDNDSKQLSPAAQAVLDAYHMRADHEGPKCPEVVLIAEALLALEEQLAQDKPAPMSSDLEVAVLTERIRMLRKINAIAAELGGWAPDDALAQPEPEGVTPDHVNLIGFAFAREPWATWLRRGGCLESAHCELSDLMLAVLARWGRPAIKPEVGEGEVEELVRRLRDWHSIPLLEERERIATLLQQLSTITTEDLKND